MLFNSYIFVFCFLPLVIIGYFLLNRLQNDRIAKWYLILMSMWFYGYFNLGYLLIFVISILLNYLASAVINKTWVPEKYHKLVAGLGIIGDIAIIFYYKYFDFFIENVNSVFHQSFTLRHLLLPLGISFFTFQQISYLVDTCRGETKNYTFTEYVLFVCFFPQLIAGPIVLHKEVIPQFQDEKKRRFQFENFSWGIYIFSIGLFKKVLLADTFGLAVDWGFGRVDSLSSMEALIVSLAYTFQIYFDFSGYCDMAKGIGRMLNITFVNNFNSPYKATSIQDFWNRWHMSLTRFLREYIYFPLGGSRKGKIRTYFNIMVVYLVSGIWHGANWTFIVWGILHGAANCLNRIFKKTWEKLGTVTQWFFTFLFVNFMWILFRAVSLVAATNMMILILFFFD